MLILAFDTCLDKTYVVLRDEKQVFSSEVIESTGENYHSAYLISTIKKVIKENGYTPKDIDAIGINIGPGSFTGIRACVTVARVMAQQIGCKLIGVSSLEILSKADEDNSVVALDARKNKAYYYDAKSDGLLGAVELEEVDNLIAGRTVITDNRLYEHFKPLAKDVVSYEKMNYDSGIILSELILDKLSKEDGNWAKVLPLYIQPPPVNV